MKIVNLELHNFRQFHGRHKVVFSTAKNKNITLFHGENNAGKTTILNAVRWCLYEEFTSNFQKSDMILNDHARFQGKNSFFVKITLDVNGIFYEIERSKLIDQPSKLSIFQVAKNGNYFRKPNEQYFINTILPKEMSKYFFYQGEGENGINGNDLTDIDASIRQVLGFSVADETLEHLRKVKNEYSRELSRSDSSGELKHLLDLKQDIEERYNFEFGVINKNELSIDKKSKELEEINTQLNKYNIAELNSINEEKTNLILKKKEIEHELKNLDDNKKMIVKKSLTSSFLRRINSFDIDTIDIEALHLKHQYTVDKGLLEDIIEKSICLCGTEFGDNSDIHKLISELSKSAVDPILKHRWSRVAQLKKKLKVDENYILEKIISNKSDRRVLDNSLPEIEIKIENASARILNIDLTEVKQLETRRVNLTGLLVSERHKLDSTKRQAGNTKKELVDLNNSIEQCEHSLGHVGHLNQLITGTQKVISLVENELNTAQVGVNELIEDKMNDLFKQVAYMGWQVRLRNNKWILVDEEDEEVATGNAYQSMLVISFIISLIQFSCERSNSDNHLITSGTVAPFMGDAFLTNIGGDNAKALVKYISNSVEQCIFLFFKDVWNPVDSEDIRSNIGKEYNLVYHTTMSEKDFLANGGDCSPLIINRVEYSTVRFGYEHKFVTIEAL